MHDVCVTCAKKKSAVVMDANVLKSQSSFVIQIFWNNSILNINKDTYLSFLVANKLKIRKNANRDSAFSRLRKQVEIRKERAYVIVGALGRRASWYTYVINTQTRCVNEVVVPYGHVHVDEKCGNVFRSLPGSLRSKRSCSKEELRNDFPANWPRESWGKRLRKRLPEDPLFLKNPFAHERGLLLGEAQSQ